MRVQSDLLPVHALRTSTLGQDPKGRGRAALIFTCTKATRTVAALTRAAGTCSLSIVFSRTLLSVRLREFPTDGTMSLSLVSLFLFLCVLRCVCVSCLFATASRPSRSSGRRPKRERRPPLPRLLQVYENLAPLVRQEMSHLVLLIVISIGVSLHTYYRHSSELLVSGRRS